SRYSRPALASDSTTCASNGTTAQAANAEITATSGAATYSTGCAAAGVTTSLTSSLNTSAKAWNTPMPTYIGPWRTCIQPSSLRSQTPKKATATITGTAMARIARTSQITTPIAPSESSQSRSGSMRWVMSGFTPGEFMRG